MGTAPPRRHARGKICGLFYERQQNRRGPVPLYEYECRKCKKHFEKIENLNGPYLKKCPSCGGTVERMMSAPAIQFKGSGWYVTDYGRSSGKNSGGKESGGKDSASNESGSKASGESGSGGSSDKSDSKSERQSESKTTASADKKKSTSKQK